MVALMPVSVNTPLPACLVFHHAVRPPLTQTQTDLVMMRWSEVLAAPRRGTFEFRDFTPA